MKSLATSLASRRSSIPPENTTSHEFEFQEVCADLEKDFGKLVWTLPFQCGNRPGVTEFNIRKAGAIARKRVILKFDYLVGILKRL